eukprot:scaffold7678_cov887-Prasinococcus_capsulatus_cf.AAC.1
MYGRHYELCGPVHRRRPEMKLAVEVSKVPTRLAAPSEFRTRWRPLCSKCVRCIHAHVCTLREM